METPQWVFSQRSSSRESRFLKLVKHPGASFVVGLDPGFIGSTEVGQTLKQSLTSEGAWRSAPVIKTPGYLPGSGLCGTIQRRCGQGVASSAAETHGMTSHD